MGELKHRASISRQILEVISKLMNFFLNNALISLNTDPTPQNIFLTIIERHILIIETCRKSHQATHLLFKYYVSKLGGGGGSRLVLILLTQGGVGGPKSGKSC